MVRGLQGDDPHLLKTAACAKHFAVHSGPEAERHGFDAQPTPKDLAETYLPAFEKLVRAGVEAVMGAYNRVNRRTLLRQPVSARWTRCARAGVSAATWSATAAPSTIFTSTTSVTANAAESAALAVRMGCDLNCGCTYTSWC